MSQNERVQRIVEALERMDEGVELPYEQFFALLTDARLLQSEIAGGEAAADDRMDEYRADFPHIVDAFERLNGVVRMARKGQWSDVSYSLPWRVYETGKRLRGLMNVVRDYRRALLPASAVVERKVEE